MVNVQASSFSSAEDVACVLNLAFAPEPWLRWQAEHLGLRMPKSVPESLGLYRQRLHSGTTTAGADGWWHVYDEDSARVTAADMSAQLDRAGWPVLERLFFRDELMARLHDGELGMVTRPSFGVLFARAQALMVMDAGPSEELEARLTYALTNACPSQRENAERFDAWVRAEAAKA